MSDTIALETARKIEAIFADEHRGGVVQRRAKVQCAVLDAIKAALPLVGVMRREDVARAICKSRSCEGVSCCEWPANGGRPNCPVKAGGYNAAADAVLSLLALPHTGQPQEGGLREGRADKIAAVDELAKALGLCIKIDGLPYGAEPNAILRSQQKCSEGHVSAVPTSAQPRAEGEK